MANTQAARMSFGVQDELGTEASIAEYAMVDPAMTVLQATTAWQAQATLLDAILGARIVRGSFTLITAMSGGKGSPDAGSRVEQNGVFNFLDAVTLTRRSGIALAGLSDSVLSGDTIDLTEGQPVDLWADSIVAAITGGGVFTNAQRQALTALVDAFLSFRKRHALNRASREIVTT